MKSSQIVNEGFIPFRGHKVWYRIVGESKDTSKLPLLCLHGGPGVPHDYLEPLEAISETGRQVIFYDQLGCGNSDHPHNPSLWTVDLFVEELGIVRQALGLERLHLFGQSWGGMLAMQYALTSPQGIAGLVSASSPSSMRQWVEEANRLRSQLPPEIQETLLLHEKNGTTEDPDYVNAMMFFYSKHVCRMTPWPDCLNRAVSQLIRDPEVYYAMNGPSEFHVTGKIKDWDITDRLGEIQIPTLITSGRYDEATPAIIETVHKGIQGSKWVLFEQSAHQAHIEESEKYLCVLSNFLCSVETQN